MWVAVYTAVYGTIKNSNSNQIQIQIFESNQIQIRKNCTVVSIRRLGIVEIPFLNNSKNKLIKLIQFHYTLSIHIEENLRLIKEIFNENLDKDHISDYSSEDNDRNEEKDIYNDEGEEKCEEISSKMFTFIPTYNTPRSSIN
ncbi:hypothetical protein C2G38_2224278 [Gigaspora rosea]|uniref:Uncharacterized protein n=1 Tax=Gigaspora rosea TaxID=44941 RepID=A0A397U0A4_9GLOM|nr:hypothetical protein C2G38_2224278 [Gigaspora rosea]